MQYTVGRYGTAQVLGQDTEGYKNPYVDTMLTAFSDETPQEVLRRVEILVSQANTSVASALNQGERMMTGAKMQALVAVVEKAFAGIHVLEGLFPDVDFHALNPVVHERIASYTDFISKGVQRMQSWDPRVAAEFRYANQLRQEAMAKGDLNSPFVPPAMKTSVIFAAYNPRQAQMTVPANIAELVKSRFNPDGSAKEGVALPVYESEEGRREIIREAIEEAPPEAFVTGPEPASPGGINPLVAAAAAGLVAFLALR